ncbi:MAG: hypothetical protein AB8B50_15930 [Pirellulaceae bacterium]
MIAQPSYLLFSDIGKSRQGASFVGDESQAGRWKFVLEHLGGPVGELPERFEASDRERGATPDRLALMAVVRGLEALEQPSRVKLVTTHRYVERGLRYGLPSWREKDYHWERFGAQIPVRNADLWKRVDIALQFHAVDCRYLQTASESEAAIHAQELSALPQLPAADKEHALGESQAGEAMHVETSAIRQTQSAFQSKYQSVRYELLANRSVATNRQLPGTRPSTKPRLSWNDRIIPARPNIDAELAVQFIPQSLQSWWHLVVGWIRWSKGRLRSPAASYSPYSTVRQSGSHSALLGV